MSSKNNNRNTSTGVKAQLNSLKSSLHGHSNDLKAIAPTGFTRKPFNTITVEQVIQNVASQPEFHIITLQGLIGELRAQLALSGEETTEGKVYNNLACKIKRIDVFTKPSGTADICSIRAYFYSLIPLYGLGPSQIGAQVPLKSLEDIGLDGAEYAKVSYTYPRDMSDMPLTVVVDQPGAGHLAVVKVVPGDKTDKVILRYHLLWNTGQEQDGQITYPLSPSPAPAA